MDLSITIIRHTINRDLIQENTLHQRKTKAVLLGQVAHYEATIAELQQQLAAQKATTVLLSDQFSETCESRDFNAPRPVVLPLPADLARNDLERKQLYRIFEQLPALINVFQGPTHVFVLANPPMRQVLGNRDLIGKTVRQAQPELEGQGIYELLDEVYRTGKPFYGNEIPVKIDRHNNGMLDECYFNFSYQPLYDEHRQIEGIISFAYEVTDLVKARQRIEESAQHLAGLNEQKDEFLSIAAHELRNPLTTIKGFAQILRKHLLVQLAWDLVSPQQAALDKHLHSADSILGQVERMSELINRLLELSRIEDKRLTLDYSAAPDLVKLVQEVIEQQRITIDKHHIVAQLPEAGLVVPYDEARIVEVLINLISNAAKYSPPDTIITVGAELATQFAAQVDEVIVWVKDQGYGIDPVQQQRLFEKFYRATNPSTEKVEGLGLGLYISCEIIKLHGGRMWLTSEPGKGSVFYFSLPVHKL